MSDHHTSPELRRFNGTASLFGHHGLQKLLASHVCVVGLGGVGSWAVEALARAGVGQLTLIDLDHVAESNINRQIQALDNTLGMAKTRALADRIAQINPDCVVNEVEEFVSEENIPDLIGKQFDCVIDCIDSFRPKAALIHWCRSQRIRLITTGGAGSRVDPTAIRITDMARSYHDALLSKTRKHLRKQHNFPTNPKRRFDVPCVFSEEQVRHPEQGCQLDSAGGGLSCAGGLGSLAGVTAGFGLAAASWVIRKLTEQTLDPADD